MDMTCQEAALKWGLSTRRVQMYCAQRRIPLARRSGGIWIIPADTEKPQDPRGQKIMEKSPFWPQLFLMDGNFVSLKNLKKTISSINDETKSTAIEAEIAYMKGNFQLALEKISSIDENGPAGLLRLVMEVSVRIALGDLSTLQTTWKKLEKLKLKYSLPSEAGYMVELSQSTIAINAYAFSLVPKWIIKGEFSGLPKNALPLAIQLRAKVLMATGKAIQAAGIIETALYILGDGEVMLGYLYIILAHANLYTNDEESAITALNKAIEIFMPMDFISPFSETLSTLLGICERCLKTSYAHQLPRIIKHHDVIANSWREAHNILTKEHLTTLLTRREFQVAITVSLGLSNKQCAEDLGISLSTFKGHLISIYQKLNIKSRKELKQFIIPN